MKRVILTIFYPLLRLLFHCLLAVLLLLPTVPDRSAKSTDSAELLSSRASTGGYALLAGQGITCDESYFYTSGSVATTGLSALAKIDRATMRVKSYRVMPLPLDLFARGNVHIGGISYYDGKIYAAVEDKAHQYPCIAVFSCETHRYITHYELSPAMFPKGVPWCTVDREKQVLYATSFSHATTLEVFRLDDMTHLASVPLKEELRRVQGGECFDGVLYVSLDDKDNGKIKTVCGIDPATGEIVARMERNVGRENFEAEGMTVSAAVDGTPQFIVLDYDRLITLYIRQYRAK